MHKKIQSQLTQQILNEIIISGKQDQKNQANKIINTLKQGNIGMKRNRIKSHFQSKLLSQFQSVSPKENINQSLFYLSQAEQVTKAKADLLDLNSQREAQNFSFGPSISTIKRRQIKKKEVDEIKGQMQLQSWSGQKVISDYYKKIKYLNQQKVQSKVSDHGQLVKKIKKQQLNRKIRYSSSLIRNKIQQGSEQELKKSQHFCQKLKQIKTQIQELKRRKIRSKSQIAARQPLSKQIILRLQKDFCQSLSPPLSRTLTQKQTKVTQSQVINHKIYETENKNNKYMQKQSKVAENQYWKKHKSNGKWIQCKKNSSNLTRIYKIQV